MVFIYGSVCTAMMTKGHNVDGSVMLTSSIIGLPGLMVFRLTWCAKLSALTLLLYEAILHLVSLTSIQILSLEVVFAYPF